MRHFKKIALVGAVVLVIGATSVTALAVSGYNTPAEIVAGLTDKTVESVIAEKTEMNQTCGVLADEYGVLGQFRSQMLEQKKAYLAERVAESKMTQERADAIIAAMEAKQADCDGTGNGGTGLRMGAAFGDMKGNRGAGARHGSGCGSGVCMGNLQN